MRYFAVIDKLSTDPRSKLQDLTTVSRGQAAAQRRGNITSYRRRQLKQTGQVTVVDPAAKASRKAGDLYEILACVDVSKAGLIDKNGKSVVKADRPPRVSYQFEVQRDSGKWYVITEKATGTC